jgi:hypothetical protein
VLNAAVSARYALKGINGGAFSSNVTTTQHAHFQGSPGTFSSQVGGNSSDPSMASLGLRFNFQSEDAKNSFLGGGGVIQITLAHQLPTSPTPGDTNMKSLLDQRGILRLTNDKVRTFPNILPLQLFSTTSPSINGSGAGTTIASQTLVSGANYTVQAATGPTWVNVLITCASSGPMNGMISFNYEIIRDTTTYMTPAITDVFPTPVPYADGDKFSGSSFLT